MTHEAGAVRGSRLSLVINGEARTLPRGTTLAQLVAVLQLDPARVALEHNREIVPRSSHAATLLGEGDCIEIVNFVGGG